MTMQVKNTMDAQPSLSAACDFVMTNIDKLAVKDQAFVLSLISGYKKYGKMSDKQLYCFRKFAGQTGFMFGDEVPDEEPVNDELLIGDTTGLQKLFDVSKSKLQYPNIRLPLGNNAGAIKLSLSSKRKGQINVAEDAPFPAKYYGFIFEGVFRPSAKMTARIPDEVPALLYKVSCDPVKTLAEIGKLRGRCCFCGNKLTDDVSVAVGYGKVCAKNWGLPYAA